MVEVRGIFRRVLGGKDSARCGEAAAPAPAPAPRRSWLERLKGGLSRSSNALSESLSDIFLKREIDPASLDEFEDALIRADLGLTTASAAMERVRSGRFRQITVGEVKAIIADEIDKVMAPVAKPLVIDSALKPHVILVVGVNGTGKTTTIGKLAAKLRAEGRGVVIAAGDTFRAAAIDQLKIWGERSGAGSSRARRAPMPRASPSRRSPRRRSPPPTSSSSTPPGASRTRTS